MPSILDPLNRRLRDILVRSKVFDSAQSLRNVFATASIAPWVHFISDTSADRVARVAALIADLHDQANDRDQNALILFLHVLLDQQHIPQGTADHHALIILLQELEPAFDPAGICLPPEPSPEAAAIPPLAIPEPDEPSMNLEDELAAFADVAIERDRHTRLILVCGESGMGKTYLLDRYRQITDAANLDYLDFDLGTQLPIEACVARIAAHIGLNHFPLYGEYIAAGPPASLTREAETRRQQTIANQFFRDLSAYIHAPRVVLFFDQYQKADPAFKAWFTGAFLPNISPHIPLIVIVAGQEEVMPLPTGRSCRHFRLNGVSIDWYHRYAQAWGVSMHPDEIKLCYEMSRGCPRNFVFLIKGRALGGAQ